MIQASFKEKLGYWNAVLQDLLEKDSRLFEIYTRFVSAPYINNVIDAKSRELINVALSASPISLCKESLKMYMKNAMSHGATEREIIEVLKLVSVLGMHTCGVGVPILVEEYNAFRNQPKETVLNEKQQELKKKFVDKMGYWNAFRDTLLENDEDFFESYYDYLTNPWESNVLSSKLKELIYIAIDSSTTHLYGPGIRTHIRNALNCGATFEEIMEVFKLTSAQGTNTFYVCIPVLNEIFSENHNR
jgi:alkylhydroperoxidase/carboxymuconolactone decarboxylase family protein YurZ